MDRRRRRPPRRQRRQPGRDELEIIRHPGRHGPAPRGPAGGFTLLELVVVLVIATGLIGLVAPRVASLFPGVELKSAARDIASALRYARGRAIASGGETAVVLDVEERTYWIEGAARPQKEGLSERIGIELLTGASELRDENTGALRFFPDGSSTGGQVALTSGERRLVVDVIWLTGKVGIFEG